MYYAGHKGSDPKPEPKIKVKKGLSKKRKPTGEANIFAEIWNERPHICVNCKVYLGRDAMAFNFAHIKSKKKFPELRLEKSNLMILCLYCHHEYDHGTKESYQKRFKP